MFLACKPAPWVNVLDGWFALAVFVGVLVLGVRASARRLGAAREPGHAEG